MRFRDLSKVGLVFALCFAFVGSAVAISDRCRAAQNAAEAKQREVNSENERASAAQNYADSVRRRCEDEHRNHHSIDCASDAAVNGAQYDANLKSSHVQHLQGQANELWNKANDACRDGEI